MQRDNESKGMKYFGEEEEDEGEEEKINDKYDEIYDNLLLKQGKNSKGKSSNNVHENEDEDLGGIYLQEDEYVD